MISIIYTSVYGYIIFYRLTLAEFIIFLVISLLIKNMRIKSKVYHIIYICCIKKHNIINYYNIT